MADPASEIPVLRARLRSSRQRLSDGVESVGESLDLPARLRQKIAAEPWKWTAIALAGGLIAAHLLPVAFGITRMFAGRRLLRALIGTAAPIAAKAGLAALSARFTNGGDAPPPPPRWHDRVDGA
jgi:hypothetical protein